MTEFIDNRGHLIEVIEHVSQIKIFHPGGHTYQAQTKQEFRDRREATEEDRRRISRELGGYA